MALPKIEVPTYEMTLPSRDEKIGFRPFTVKEEKILMIASESENKDEIFNAVTNMINACTFNKLDVKKLFADEIDLMLEFTRFLEEGNKNNSTVTPEPYKKENYWKAYSFIPEAERLFKDCRTRGEIESTSLFISPKAVQRLLPIVAKVPRTTLADGK